jgi:hypothetical protein
MERADVNTSCRSMAESRISCSFGPQHSKRREHLTELAGGVGITLYMVLQNNTLRIRGVSQKSHQGLSYCRRVESKGRAVLAAEIRNRT